MLDKAGRRRKLIHFFTGLFIYLLTFFLEKNVLLWLIVAGSIFAFVTFPLKKFRFLHHTRRQSYGTLFYPAGIFSAFLVLYDQPMYLFQISLLLLTISDTLANIFGNWKYRNLSFRIAGDYKSLHGTTAFLLSATAILFLILPEQIYKNVPFFILLLIAFLNFELISIKGSDNLTIPLGSALLLQTTELQTNNNIIYLILLWTILSSGSYFLYKLNLLSRYGSLLAYLLGFYLFTFPGIKWAIPVLFFFFTSAFFTFLRSKLRSKKSNSPPRNAWQVLANILPAVLVSVLFLITEKEIFILLYITLIAAVTADTWASELGPLFSSHCYSVANFRKAQAGISGGISVAGSVAALIASFLVALLSYYLFFGTLGIRPILFITFSGFMATFIDSLLGAFWEPKLLRNKFFSGRNKTSMELITPNDLVNIAGSATAPFFFLLF